MSSYRRFIPRDEWTTSAPMVAEAAEVAEAEANQGNASAEALLKAAEVPFEALQLQQASAEVQQRQWRRNRELQQLQQLQPAPDPKIAETRDWVPGSHARPSHAEAEGSSERPGIPTRWCEGMLRLGAMPPPRHYPKHAWQQLSVDAERFLDDWAQQAVALGWADWELFGCHRRAPWRRLDGMGLVLALQGRQLAALTGTQAVIHTAQGAHLTHRRKPRDPLHPSERCLVWGLG